MVKEIIPANGEIISFADVDLSQLSERGLAVAAMIEIEPPNGVDNMEQFAKELAEVISFDGEELSIEDVKQFVDELKAEAIAKADEAYDEGLAAGKKETTEKAVKQAVEPKDAELADKNFEIAALKAEMTEMVEKIESAEREKAEALDRIKQLDGGFKAGNGEPTNGNNVEDYWQAVDELVVNGFSKDAAMLKVQREQPELHKAMIAAANK